MKLTSFMQLWPHYLPVDKIHLRLEGKDQLEKGELKDSIPKAFSPVDTHKKILKYIKI